MSVQYRVYNGLIIYENSSQIIVSDNIDCNTISSGSSTSDIYTSLTNNYSEFNNLRVNNNLEYKGTEILTVLDDCVKKTGNQNLTNQFTMSNSNNALTGTITTSSLTVNTSKPITNTTALSSSSETDDAIIATKYYVDNGLSDKITKSVNDLTYYTTTSDADNRYYLKNNKVDISKIGPTSVSSERGIISIKYYEQNRILLDGYNGFILYQINSTGERVKINTTTTKSGNITVNKVGGHKVVTLDGDNGINIYYPDNDNQKVMINTTGTSTTLSYGNIVVKDNNNSNKIVLNGETGLTLGTSLAVNSTTAFNSSLNQDDTILTTKYYVDSNNIGKSYPNSTNGEIFNDYTNNIASGNYSHSGGNYTTANSQSLTAIGQYNTNDGTNYNTVNRLLVVGNGSDVNNRSDAFVVKNNGEVIINSTTSGTTPSLTIGPNSKAITGTTASSSSINADDAILATKYYIDDLLQTININYQKFIYYGPGKVYYSLLNGSTRTYANLTTYMQVSYDYNNNNPNCLIKIPKFMLALGSSNLRISIMNVQIDNLGHHYRFAKNYNPADERAYCGCFQGIKFSNNTIEYLRGTMTVLENDTIPADAPALYYDYIVDLYFPTNTSYLTGEQEVHYYAYTLHNSETFDKKNLTGSIRLSIEFVPDTFTISTLN